MPSSEDGQPQALQNPKDPYQWSASKKWRVTWLAVCMTFLTNVNGTIITVAHGAINEAFHVSDATFPNSYWPVTSWALGGAVFSLLVLPLLEDFGVRPGYLGTYLAFICFIIPQGVTQNFATLVVTRFFAGGCVAILANTAASIVGNIWKGEFARTIPISLYITTYLAGISTGPAIGGVVLQNLGWRWISYMQIIWFAVLFPFYFLLLDESRGSIVSQDQPDCSANRFDEKSPKWIRLFRRLGCSIRRPLYMLFTEPVLLLFTLWDSFAVGTVYLFTQSVEQVFSGIYGFTSAQAGYVQAAAVVGIYIGWSCTLVSRKLWVDSAKHNTEAPGVPCPEARLYTSVIGSLVGLAGGMFVYGWTFHPNIPWIAPAIGLGMVGFGINTVVMATGDYVVDAYAKYAGSAMAAVVLGEMLAAAFMPLAANSMYTNLGFHWASSLLGFLSLVLSIAPLVLVRWGRRIREQSPFMKEALIDRGEITKS